MIQRLQPFPRLRGADDEASFRDDGRIERMHGLAQFDHHVVRGVHHIGYRPDPGGHQPHLHGDG